jgi:hypothetical protein
MKACLVQRHTHLCLSELLPDQSYAMEAIRKQDMNRITVCKMKSMQRTAAYTKWDHKRNEDILDKPKIKPVIDRIQNYQRNWKEHVERMNI